MLDTVGAATPPGTRRAAVALHVELVRRAGVTSVPESHDRERIDRAARRALRERNAS
jgi:hypothetical protein